MDQRPPVASPLPQTAEPAATIGLSSDAGGLQALRDAARRNEPDRYLAALLAPAGCQPDLLALAAFAGELARIPATVSDPMIGEIRLQWWRDAVEAGLRGETTGHPVADALATTIRTRRLPMADIHSIIDARAFDLSGDLHAGDDALEANMAAGEGLLLALGHQIVTGQVLPAGIAAQAGLAYGLARALGRLPALLHNGGFPVPATLLAREGVSRGMLAERPFAEATVAGVEQAAMALEGRARQALATVRTGFARHTCDVSAAMLPLAMVEPYFKAQNRVGFRRLEQIADVLPLSRLWHLSRARLTARI